MFDSNYDDKDKTDLICNSSLFDPGIYYARPLSFGAIHM
jgi:hypothetical protein